MIPVLHGVWAAAGASALITDAYEHIETQTVGAGGAASITFSSIPGTYKQLQIRFISQQATFTANTASYYYLRFNGDTASNYSAHELVGTGSAANSAAAIGNTYTNPGVSYVVNSASSIFAVGIIDILDYGSTSKFKTVRALGGYDNNANGWAELGSGLWRSTSAVTSITVTQNASYTLQQYSSFSLYGVK